ncbi:unnamed protein product, partial [Effrenium voratum]
MWRVLCVLLAFREAPAALGAAVPAGHVVGGERLDLVPVSVGPVTAMRFAPAWDVFFVGGDLGTLQAFQGDLSLVNAGNVGSRVTAIIYQEALSEVAAGGADGRLVFLQASNLQVVATVSENEGGSQVTALAYVSYSDDVTSYSEVASCSYFSSNIKLWSMSSKALTRELSGHNNIVLALASLDSQLLASGSLDSYLGIWSLPLAKLQVDGSICSGSILVPLSTSYQLDDCIRAVLGAGADLGGRFFVYGQAGTSSANECQLLESEGSCSTLTAAPYTMYRVEVPLKHMIKAHDGPVRAVEFLPQQGLVASGGDDGTIRAWNPDTGLMVREFGGVRAMDHGVNALAYVGSLGALVATSLFHITFFDTNGEVLSQIARSASSPALVLSMDARQRILSSKGTEIEVWPHLTLCQDGSAPASTSRCEACPSGRAGVGGFCDLLCTGGTQSTGTQCAACDAGRAGDGQSCWDCSPGEFQEQPGQVACQQCPRGSAQPLARQTRCTPCVDATAATGQGSEDCQTCPDGTEPTVDHTECRTCVSGAAGTGGICVQCLDGQQNSVDFSICLECPTGTAGTSGFCSPCPEGTQPDENRQTCEPCLPGFAGALGVCSRCPAGEQPDAASALCVACIPGRAGLNGTCSVCPVGMVASTNRSVCLFCDEGQIAQMFTKACETCPDGQMPAENRSLCLDCPPGFAGTGGLCSLCPEGTGASEDHSVCSDCPEGFFGSRGFCGQCPNGTQPRDANATNTSALCVPCPYKTAGNFGLCLACPDGTQQDASRSRCERCPVGTAGVGGECLACEYPLMQDSNRTSCTQQLASPLLLYAASRCSAHSCRTHFSQLDVEQLFCCPTPQGDYLACCDFDEEGESFGRLLSRGFSLIMTATSTPIVAGPLIFVSECLLLAVLCRIWKSDAWADWRELLEVSVPGLLLMMVWLFL